MTSRQISAARSLATPYLARAVVLLLFLPATASSDVIRLTAADDRELVIETEDPEVEVTIKGEQTVGIVDRKTGREYRLDRADMTLIPADDPDGLRVTLDAGKTVDLRRDGKRIVAMSLHPLDRQVQLQVSAVLIRPAEAKEFAGRWLKSEQEAVFSALSNEHLRHDVQTLVAKGAARILTLPTVMTRSGRSSEMTVAAPSTVVHIVPNALHTGKIALELTGAKRIAAKLKDGETLVVAGLVNPMAGTTKEDKVLLLVTPRLVAPNQPPLMFPRAWAAAKP